MSWGEMAGVQALRVNERTPIAHKLRAARGANLRYFSGTIIAPTLRFLSEASLSMVS
jgi:hypothetical protein